MKYEVGDDIVVLHSNDEGKVVEIINEKMVLIEVKGVKFPAYMDQIDFPYFKRFTAKKLIPEKKPKVYVDQVQKEDNGKLDNNHNVTCRTGFFNSYKNDRGDKCNN